MNKNKNNSQKAVRTGLDRSSTDTGACERVRFQPTDRPTGCWLLADTQKKPRQTVSACARLWGKMETVDARGARSAESYPRLRTVIRCPVSLFRGRWFSVQLAAILHSIVPSTPSDFLLKLHVSVVNRRRNRDLLPLSFLWRLGWFSSDRPQSGQPASQPMSAGWPEL